MTCLSNWCYVVGGFGSESGATRCAGWGPDVRVSVSYLDQYISAFGAPKLELWSWAEWCDLLPMERAGRAERLQAVRYRVFTWPLGGVQTGRVANRRACRVFLGS